MSDQPKRCWPSAWRSAAVAAGFAYDIGDGAISFFNKEDIQRLETFASLILDPSEDKEA